MLLSATVLLLATAMVTVPVYYWIFSNFSDYDDEGCMMMSVQEVLSGHMLYDGTYLQYGPAYYLVQWLVHRITRAPVVHNVVRLLSMIFWLATALGMGTTVLLLTESRLAAAAGVLVATFHLKFISYEPGHPQELCIALVALAAVGLACVRGRNRAWGLVVAAGATGVLAMTKINAGAYVGLPLGAGMILLSGRSFLTRIARPLVIAALLLLPLALMTPHIRTGWGFALWFSITVSIACALIVVHRHRIVLLGRCDWICAVAAAVIGAGLPVLWVLVRGTSLHGLLDGVLWQHIGFANRWYIAAPTGRSDIVCTAAMLLLAIVWSSERVIPKPWSDLILSAAKLGSLAAVGLAFVGFGRASTVVRWMPWMIGARRGLGESVGPRILLTLMFSMQMLYAYPVAGSQFAYGSLFGAVAAVIAAHDGILELNQRFSEKLHLLRQAAVPAVAVLLLLVYATATYWAGRDYYRGVPLALRGADRVRLPAEQAARLRSVVEALPSSCKALFSMPGLFSFNFWTDISTPTRINQTNWIGLITDEQQQIIIHDLQSTRACLIANSQLVNFWLRGQDIAKSPLANYIHNQYSVVQRVGPYEVLIPNPHRP